MKDSGIKWIGEIPNDWFIYNIGSCTTEVNTPNGNSGEINALQFKMGEIIRKSDGNSKYNPETLEAYNLVDEGVVMINGLNLSFDLISQRVGLVKERGVITSTYIAIRPNENLYPFYFNYLMKAYDNCKAFHAMGRGLRQTLSYGELKKHPIIVPPFHLQQQIAKFLDDKCADIDQLIALQQQMIDELKAYKQSVITEAVCKGLDKSVPMKDSGIEWIGEVPKGWKIRKVKTLSIMINGYAFDSQKFGLNNKNKVLRIGDIFDGVINREITTNIDDVIELEKYILQENDIVIALSGATVGKIGYVNNLNNEKIYVNQRVGIIRADNHKLLFYFLQSNVFRKYVELLSWGSAQPNISLNQIGEFKIPFSVSDGLSIVSYLDQKCSQIDTLISIKQQKIEELKEYKKSMIYEYITGKKQVPNE